jgi:hypothetical protein
MEKICSIRSVAVLVGMLAAGLMPFATTVQGATYPAYAGPNVFGPWAQVGSHAGAITYTISASPVGKTMIVGEVMYFGVDGQRKVEPFYGSTVIRTCNCWATVLVRFKGIPLGTVVNVSVNP